MKSQFRTNIEQAIVNARVGGVVGASCVFVDRNKCSDRIKFSFTSATDAEIERIQTEVEKMYPNNDVDVYNNASKHFCSYRGVAVSVKHPVGVKL